MAGFNVSPHVTAVYHQRLWRLGPGPLVPATPVKVYKGVRCIYCGWPVKSGEIEKHYAECARRSLAPESILALHHDRRN